MSDQNSKSGVIVVLVMLAVLVGGASWYWFTYRPKQEAKEKARLEQMAKEEAEIKRKELAVQDTVKYNKLIADANVEFGLENWKLAQSLYTEASVVFPNEQYPKDQLALVKIKLDEIAILEAKRNAGIVETVSFATNRYYIIVSSSIDDDLAMDYANKLAKEGNFIKIIAHETDNLIYYRVSVGDYDTREQAESALASYSTYSNGVWVLKY